MYPLYCYLQSLSFCYFMTHLDGLNSGAFMLLVIVHICVYCHYPLVAGSGIFFLSEH